MPVLGKLLGGHGGRTSFRHLLGTIFYRFVDGHVLDVQFISGLRRCGRNAALSLMNTLQLSEEIIFLLEPMDWIPPGCLVHVLDLFLNRGELVHSGG